MVPSEIILRYSAMFSSLAACINLKPNKLRFQGETLPPTIQLRSPSRGLESDDRTKANLND